MNTVSLLVLEGIEDVLQTVCELLKRWREWRLKLTNAKLSEIDSSCVKMWQTKNEMIAVLQL